jgi:hypothetical protein
MTPKLEYDGWVKRFNWATSAVSAACVLLFAGLAVGQINAAPPSVTSMGFGGRTFNGAPPSVTFLGPRGYTPGFNPAFPNSRLSLGSGSGTHHHHYHSYVPLGAAVYAVPIYGYGYADAPDDADNAPPEDQYNGGPTMFDRRGPGTAYRTSSSADRDSQQVAAYSEPGMPDPPPAEEPQTVLVFKDGHEAEVGNYAIVGNMLYDLTGGSRRKIALSDLDLDATTKANDDRGIDFAVPPGAM